MQVHTLTIRHLYVAPRTIAVVATHIVVGLHIAERKVRPIQIQFFHNFLFILSTDYSRGLSLLFYDIEHLDGRLDGSLRLVGIEAAGLEGLALELPSNDGLHESIGATAWRN